MRKMHRERDSNAIRHLMETPDLGFLAFRSGILANTVEDNNDGAGRLA
jgi:hypothetical protein